MRYFVTGGAGFIGANYVEFLIDNLPDLSGVTVYDKFTYAANPKNLLNLREDDRFQLITGDVCDSKALNSAIKEHDYVIHFAAESHVDRSINSAFDFVNTNVVGTLNVLEASKNAGVKTVIHVSTDEVYGSLQQGFANENSQLMPNSPYAASKAASDLIARSFHVTHGLDVRITRCCNNFGKYQFPEKLIPVFINKILNKEKIPIYGDGKNVREWIHVQDHAKGIQTVLQKGVPGEIYNIGSGVFLSNNEMADKLISYFGVSADSKKYVEDRKGHDFRYAIDSRKISQLGFKPQIDFQDGFVETICWYVENRGWWN